MTYPSLNSFLFSFHLFICILNELWNSSSLPGMAIGWRSCPIVNRPEHLPSGSRYSIGVVDVR